MHEPFEGLAPDGERRLEALVVSMAIRRTTVDGTQLLVQRRYVEERHWGTWELPQGHVKPTETLAGAAVRETFEETGLRLTVDGSSPLLGGAGDVTTEALAALCVVAVDGGISHFSVCLEGRVPAQSRATPAEDNGPGRWMDPSELEALVERPEQVYPLNLPMIRAWLARYG